MLDGEDDSPPPGKGGEGVSEEELMERLKSEFDAEEVG
jgi:hypothetical protein